MSDQENKIPTATEIERQLRELRQKELKQPEEKTAEAATPEKQQLGIQKLKKSRKGLIVIVAAAVLLALGISAYYVPSIIRAISGGDDKPVSNTVSTGSVKRQQGLSDDIDPFNAAQKTTPEQTATKTDSVAKPPEPVRHDYSRALDVTYGGSSSSGSSSGIAVSQTSSNDKPAENGTKQAATQPVSDPKASLTKITRVPYDPNLFVPENTAIPCSLDRRFVSDLTGRLICTINTDIYSANGNVKLIERGTGAHLIYKSGTLQHGQGRVFVMATKLRTRTEPFIDIPLIDSQAAGALGEAGADGWIDTHFLDRFMGAMMIGIIPDLSQWASGAANNNKDSQTDYTANSRQAFADIAREAFSNTVNIPPTLYKNQGDIITLIVGQDLDFSGIYRLKIK